MSEEPFSTSAEAFKWCVENGVVSQRVAEVLKVLCDGMHAMNQTMAHQAIIQETGKVGMEKYSVSPRFVVLERMGLIRQVGKLPCPVTGRTTLFYEPTNTRPKCSEAEALKPQKTRESDEALRKEIAELKEDNAKLRELLAIRSARSKERSESIRRTPIAIQTSFL